MQEHPHRLAASEHVGYELAGQCLGGEEGHEDPGRLRRLRIGWNTYLAAFTHFLDDTQDPFLG
ncbi:hypothetical protein D3C81_1964940 [compost metagenome]